MHSEPQRCFRLQPLRTYRRRFVHYYSASYLTLLRIRISLFEYHPNTGIHSSFMPYYSRFLQYRQITFYGTFRYRHCYRHFLSCYKRIFLNHRNDISLTTRQFPYRHITDICYRHITDIPVTFCDNFVYRLALNNRHHATSIFFYRWQWKLGTMSFGTGKQVI